MQHWLIVGLGNPGPRYEKTRHNAGFLFLDCLAACHGAGFRKDHSGLWAVAQCPGFSCVKPLTWMNDSGAIFSNAEFVPRDDMGILVAVDTMDLPAGALRLKKKSGTAGHNGLKSIQSMIGASYHPLYIGIGRPGEAVTVIDHVLGNFTLDEEKLLQGAMTHAVSCMDTLLHRGIDETMNCINSWKSGIEVLPKNTDSIS